MLASKSKYRCIMHFYICFNGKYIGFTIYKLFYNTGFEHGILKNFPKQRIVNNIKERYNDIKFA